MGQSLADSFSEKFKEEFAERSVKTGSIIKIYDKEAKKEKWHLIVGMSTDKILLASVRINSELNVNCIPDKSRPYHTYIKKEKNPFLAHDSYVDCSKLITYKRHDFVKWVEKNTQNLLGEMTEKELDTIKSIIADCPEIEPVNKKQFGLL
jgi:hypothetical protein